MAQAQPDPDIRYPDVVVKLSGTDGNAFSVLGEVRRALRHAGLGREVDRFTIEATSGDFGNLIATVARWVTVE